MLGWVRTTDAAAFACARSPRSQAIPNAATHTPMPSALHSALLPKLLASAPSALMAAAFLWVWLQPYAFGLQSVRDLLLVLAVE